MISSINAVLTEIAVAELTAVRGKLADAQAADQRAGDLANELCHAFAKILNTETQPVRDDLRHILESAAANLRIALTRVRHFDHLIGLREPIRVEDMLAVPVTGMSDELAPWSAIGAATTALLRRQK